MRVQMIILGDFCKYPERYFGKTTCCHSTHQKPKAWKPLHIKLSPDLQAPELAEMV